MTAATAALRVKRIYGRMGIACWLLIIPLKLSRHLDVALHPPLVDAGPSFFGSLGLLLVVLSSERRLARITLARATLLAGAVALGLEFVQALPLGRRLYTFDWLDVALTVAGLAAGVALAAAVRRVGAADVPDPPG